MNPIKMIFDVIAEKKRRRKWELYWEKEEREHQESLKRLRERNFSEPFLREVDWPDDLIEEYYVTMFGRGVLIPREKEEK